MPDSAKLIEELQTTSDKLSEISRTISLSILALAWLFISGSADKPTLPHEPDHGLLLLTALLVLASLLADYLQYASGYANTKDVLSVAEQTGAPVKYNDKAFLYRFRTVCFWGKQLLALGSFATLVVAVGQPLLCS
jgi:hypothetical protein